MATPGANHTQLGENYIDQGPGSCMYMHKLLTRHTQKGHAGLMPIIYCQLMLAPNPIKCLAPAARLENVDSRKILLPSDLRMSQALIIRQRKVKRPLQELTKAKIPRDD